MGLIKTAFFKDNAYHRISSFEFHRDRQRLRIRTDIYPTVAKEKIIATREFQVDERLFINNSRMEAEKVVNMESIKSLASDKILEVEKELNKGLKKGEEKKVLTQTSKTEILNEIKDFTITERMKVIGRDNFRKFVEDLESKPRKTMALLYDALKLLTDELKNAEDA